MYGEKLCASWKRKLCLLTLNSSSYRSLTSPASSPNVKEKEELRKTKKKKEPEICEHVS